MPGKLDTLIKDIKDAAQNLVTLEIVTAVGDISVETPSGSKKKTFEVSIPAGKQAKAMFSQINLLQGDIKTLFHEDFMTREYEDLRAFHRSRESQGHEIIRQNIALLKQLFEYVKGLSRDQ